MRQSIVAMVKAIARHSGGTALHRSLKIGRLRDGGYPGHGDGGALSGRGGVDCHRPHNADVKSFHSNAFSRQATCPGVGPRELKMLLRVSPGNVLKKCLGHRGVYCNPSGINIRIGHAPCLLGRSWGVGRDRTMALQLRCPNCGKMLRVSDRLLGRTAPCPNCKSPITVPIPPERRRTAEAVVSKTTLRSD